MSKKENEEHRFYEEGREVGKTFVRSFGVLKALKMLNIIKHERTDYTDNNNQLEGYDNED